MVWRLLKNGEAKHWCPIYTEMLKLLKKSGGQNIKYTLKSLFSKGDDDKNAIVSQSFRKK